MKGFTLIESLLVIGIFSFVASFAVPIGLNFYRSHQLETVSQEIIQNARKAQLQSMMILRDSSFGIHFDAQKNAYILFQGTSYAARATQFDETYLLPKILKESGLQEVVFSKEEGKPNVIGDIVVSTDTNTKSTININAVGRINLK